MARSRTRRGIRALASAALLCARCGPARDALDAAVGFDAPGDVAVDAAASSADRALPDPAEGGLPTACAWSDVRAGVLGRCLGGGCHEGAAPAGGLALDAAGAWANLVGVPATIAPAQLRVVAGDPDHSFVWRKLTDRLAPAGAEGAPMPLDEGLTTWQPLAAAPRALLYCWIVQGARAP